MLTTCSSMRARASPRRCPDDSTDCIFRGEFMPSAPTNISTASQSEQAAVELSYAAGGARLPSFRWMVCALLFMATTINYMDRQLLGLLAPVLEKQIGWSELPYSRIVIAFQAAYAL